MYRKELLWLVLIVFVITGCANSASHKVVKEEKASDEYLTCGELRTEKRKVQAIISGVEQDKEDMTGADFVDGILWFPFNVIAKQSNYANATKAAEARIEHLSMLEEENGCKTTLTARDRRADKKRTTQLKQLNSLYREGVLTKEEYLAKREKILATVQTDNGGSQLAAKRRMGQYAFEVERKAKDSGCDSNGGSNLLSKEGPIEIYQVNCKGSEPFIFRCEYTTCNTVN